MPLAPRLVQPLVKPALHDAWIISRRRFDGIGRRGSFGFRFRVRLRRLQPSDLDIAVTPFGRRRLGLRSVCGGCIWRGDRAAGCRASVGGWRRRALNRWLAVGNEFRIAWGTGPRRRVGWQTAGPMRPTIGDITAACAQHHGERKDCACGQKPFDNHAGCRVVRPARRMPPAPLTIVSDRVAGH